MGARTTHYVILTSVSPALSQDFVETAVTFLVTRFMPLNPNDLEGWMANPEEWVNTEDKDDEQWQFELRVSLTIPAICIFSQSRQPCAERVLMTLSNQYREFVTQLLVKAFANVNGRRPLHIADNQFFC